MMIVSSQIIACMMNQDLRSKSYVKDHKSYGIFHRENVRFLVAWRDSIGFEGFWQRRVSSCHWVAPENMRTNPRRGIRAKNRPPICGERGYMKILLLVFLLGEKWFKNII
jgi:hypothetical protein